MIISWFTSFHWALLRSAVIKSPIFRSGYDCTSTSSARSLSTFSSSNRYRNLGPSESACRHCAYPNPGSTFARDSIGNSWEELEVSRCPCDGSPRSSTRTLSSTKFSLNSCSLSGKSRNSSHCNSSSSSYLMGGFSVFAGSGNGFLRNSTLITSTSFCCGIFRANHRILRWKCWRRCRWRGRTRW